MYLIFLNYTLLIGGENTWGISHRDMVIWLILCMHTLYIVAIAPEQLLLDTCTCHVIIYIYIIIIHTRNVLELSRHIHSNNYFKQLHIAISFLNGLV